MEQLLRKGAEVVEPEFHPWVERIPGFLEPSGNGDKDSIICTFQT